MSPSPLDETGPPRSPATVIFDGDCGICNATREWLEARDLGGRMQFLPYQTANLNDLSPGLTVQMASRMAYFVRPDGTRTGGARAVFLCLSRLPGPWGLVGRMGAFPLISLLCEPVYRLIAANRSRISGWLGLSYCLVDGRPQRVDPS